MEDYKKTPLWDNQLDIEKRLDYLIKEMTLEEKILCMTTHCPEVKRLGIKESHFGGEAAHGVQARHDQEFENGGPEETTCFTQPIGMSASFDRALIKKCGDITGKEARALNRRRPIDNGLSRWAPTVDMERDPRWGRTEESYGEDPFLTGEMASAYVQGMQGEDPFYIQCAATLKHFYANNVEENRVRTSSSVDERNKYEYYLEPFRKVVEEGKAEAVMTSYNEINGVPAMVNPEVLQIVKNTWGLPGHVVCDGGDFSQTVTEHHYFDTHAESLAYGLKAGIDCFTDSPDFVLPAVREALDKKRITKEDIDLSIRNAFRTRIRLGFFDAKEECPYTAIGEEAVNSPENQAVCQKMQEESVVLLKNDQNCLPLQKDTISSIAVVGPLADVWNKDWYGGIPPYCVTPLMGIRKEFPRAEIHFHNSLMRIKLTCNGKYIGIDEKDRLCLSDQGEIFVFTDWGCQNATLFSESRQKYVTLEQGSYLITASSKETFNWFIREQWSFIKQENGSYHINSWNGRNVTVREEGFLTVIKDQTIAVGEGDDGKSGKQSFAVFEGISAGFEMEVLEDGIEESVQLASKADKTIVVLGCNPVINSKEEIDRTSLLLPPSQQKLADAVLAVCPEAVIVLVTNYPYTITKLNQKAKAILCSASGSQELGTGIAGVLSGRVNPAGRLNMTWYRSLEDLPDMNNYDIIQQNRTYQYFEKEVLYPFGYGLSYTSFEYGKLTVKEDDDTLELTIPVTNTGALTGDEVVQFYVHMKNSRVKRPLKQLKGFERLHEIKPGETAIASVRISKKELRYFDVISRTMLLETGNYELMAGASSDDIRSTCELQLRGEKAKKRNPEQKTLAMQYDESRDIYLHRGTKGHAMHGETCVLSLKNNGELIYHDFEFQKQPSEMKLMIYSEEGAKVTVYCEKEGIREKIADYEEKRSSDDFQEVTVPVEMRLPEAETRTVILELQGKIKVKDFYFVRNCN